MKILDEHKSEELLSKDLNVVKSYVFLWMNLKKKFILIYTLFLLK